MGWLPRPAKPFRVPVPTVMSLSIALAIHGGFGGCASKEKPDTVSRSGVRTTDRSRSTTEAPAPVTINQPMLQQQTVFARAGVLSLGSVPYDSLALPLVSPDGMHIATQAGAAPTWPTAQAEQEAEVPAATRLQVYRLDRREGIVDQERRSPELIATLAEPCLLGRSCDNEGFLVESPREDGSRWIGKASWLDGAITWLVNDGHVNAFASLGEQGRLAWSRRAVDGSNFDLAVRSLGAEWTIESLGDDWLFPTFAAGGDGLFVFNLNVGNLELRYGLSSSAVSFRQAMQRFNVASESTPFTAYQASNGTTTSLDPLLTQREQIVFFHPAIGRMAVWRPLSPSGQRAVYLNSRSIAALVDHDELAFVSTEKELLRQNMFKARERIGMVAGTHIVRPTTLAAWPYVLMQPRAGQIHFLAMRLAPYDPSEATGGR